MEQDKSITPETFYNRLKNHFPRVTNHNVWVEWRNETEDYVHSMILSALAEEVIIWAQEGDYQGVRSFLNEIENALNFGDSILVSYIGTDFTVSILECKDSMIREKIKSMMGPRTAGAYKTNLGGYREPG
ncbi:MAG: hypothetical protein EOO04_22005 [Chitinophagaceae bacterium]|nr:MAG: hypothetical protein EOO04_22005 [Chitinophagaceae bacterium]